MRKSITITLLIVVMSVSLMAQTPGSDFGPAGTSAGLAQPDMSCYGLQLWAAMMGMAAFTPGMGGVFGPFAAFLATVYAAACY